MSGPFNQFARDRKNSATQPNPRFWNNYNNLSSGLMELDPGDYNLLQGSGFGVGANDIDVIYVPPNYTITANSDGRSGANPAFATFTGTDSNTDEPGVYWNFSGNTYGIGINNIDVLGIKQATDLDETDPDGTKTVPYTWDRFKGKCCAGALPSSSCGIHAPGATGSDCNRVFKSCTGTDLKIPYDSNPSYRSQYCSAMAKANTSTGDIIKKKYCSSNPSDSFCSCMNLTSTAEYIRWAKIMNIKHPEVVISPLMYMDAAGGNPCRKHLTTDMQTQFIPSELIKQIGHLPSSYSITDLTVSGNNNILTDIKIDGRSVAPPASGSAGGSDKPANMSDIPTDISYTNYIIIAFVIIIAAVCYWSFTDHAPVPSYQQSYPQSNQQSYQQPYQTVRR